MRNLLAVGLLCAALPLFAAKEKDLSHPQKAAVRAAEPAVTIDVKDLETRKILKEIQKQCGMKNLIVDPDVRDEKGTFRFNNVPCSAALKVVLRSLGLDSVTYSNALVNVSRKK